MNEFIEKARSFGYNVKTINDKLIEMKDGSDCVCIIVTDHTDFQELSDKLKKRK